MDNIVKSADIFCKLIYTCVCVCVRARAHAHIYIHTHTHIHTHEYLKSHSYACFLLHEITHAQGIR
jgi:hypothetical protein